MKALLHCLPATALGLFVACLNAEEVEWRAARPRVEATPATATSPVRLGLPAPSDANPDRIVALGIVRAKNEPDDPRPLPIGPTLKGDPKDSKSEYIPGRPTPLPAAYPGAAMMPPDACGPAGCDPCCGPIRSWVRECRAALAECKANVCDFGSRLFCGGGDACDPGCCAARPCWWVNGSYLLWSISGQQAPPLVTVNQNDIPVIGTPGTSVVLGGDNLENEVRSGFRGQFGFWLPRRDWLGLQVGFMSLGNNVEQFALSSTGTPQVGRPFINADNGLPFSELVAGPGVSGSILVEHDFYLWGLDFHLRKKGCCGPRGWCDWFIGYRHLNLDERLSIVENLTAGTAPTRFVINDQFGTQNIFNGLDVGFQMERRIWRRWYFQGTARIAVGNMNQIVDISGSTTRTIGAGAPETQPGGFAALPSNIGKVSRDRLAFVPEVGFKIGLDVTERLRVYAGYDFLWISDVVRPAEQYDPVINLGQLPFRNQPNTGQARPTVLFRTSDFWAQGVNFGLEYRW